MVHASCRSICRCDRSSWNVGLFLALEQPVPAQRGGEQHGVGPELWDLGGVLLAVEQVPPRAFYFWYYLLGLGAIASRVAKREWKPSVAWKQIDLAIGRALLEGCVQSQFSAEFLMLS